MAGTIPVYESKKGIDLQLVPRMSNEGSNRTARAGEGLTNATNNAIETMTKVQETQEQNAANVYATEQLTALKTRAEEDPDFKSADKYEKEAARIGGDAAKTISGANAREAFMSRYTMSQNSIMSGIKSTFMERQLKAAHADLITGIEVQKNAYLTAKTPQEKSLAAAMIKQSITDNVNGLVISPDDGAKLWISIQKDLPEKQALWDISKDDATDTKESHVFTELEKGAEGEYASLDPIQRSEAMKQARVKINDNKQFMYEAKVNNRLDVLKRFVSGEIDPLTNSDEIKNISIEDPDLGEAIRAGTDKLFIPSNDDEAFTETVKNVFEKSTTREDVAKFLMNTLNANDNKRISRDRLAILVNASVDRASELKATAEHSPAKQTLVGNEKSAAVKSILKMRPPFSVASVLVNYFDAVSAGKTPAKAREEAVKTEVTRVNPLSTKYKIGDIVTNPNTKESAEVIGINEVGTPILRRKTRGQ